MDTFLSTMLVKAGCSKNQAAAFERFLDDRPICGIGNSVLVRAILGICVSDMVATVSAIRELQQENENLRKQVLEFERDQMGLAVYR
jgi:hypothetical protein